MLRAAESAREQKEILAYFYQALKKIREAKNINLEPKHKKNLEMQKV